MRTNPSALLALLLSALLTTQPFLFWGVQEAYAESENPSHTEQLLQSGKDAYEQLDYEDGIQLLRELLSEEGITDRQRRDAFLYLGLGHACLGNEKEAMEAFLRLLEIDPAYRLDPNLFSPKVLGVFEQAQSAYQETLRYQDKLPPVLEHTEISQPVPYRRPVTITARVHDNIKTESVQLFFRKQGEAAYIFLPMELRGEDEYFANIPGYMIETGGVEYYVMAMDVAGNAALKGNASLPLLIRVEPGPELKPWYKKWWVWAVLGTAAGAGVALGVTLTSSSEDAGGKATVRITVE